MAKAEREMLNVKGRKASSNTSRLHVLSLLSSGCICDERIFHKIYLTRSEIISALLLVGCFSTLNVVCNPKVLPLQPCFFNRMYPYQSLTFSEKPKKKSSREKVLSSQFKDKKISFQEITRWKIYFSLLFCRGQNKKNFSKINLIAAVHIFSLLFTFRHN